MIVVYVQHFLREEERYRFDGWIERVREALRSFNGFRRIDRLHPVEGEENGREECHLLLQFETLPQLRAWASSEEHDRLVAELAPYRRRKQQSRIFRQKEHSSQT